MYQEALLIANDSLQRQLRCCLAHPHHPVVGVCAPCLRERLSALAQKAAPAVRCSYYGCSSAACSEDDELVDELEEDRFEDAREELLNNEQQQEEEEDLHQLCSNYNKAKKHCDELQSDASLRYYHLQQHSAENIDVAGGHGYDHESQAAASAGSRSIQASVKLESEQKDSSTHAQWKAMQQQQSNAHDDQLLHLPIMKQQQLLDPIISKSAANRRRHHQLKPGRKSASDAIFSVNINNGVCRSALLSNNFSTAAGAEAAGCINKFSFDDSHPCINNINYNYPSCSCTRRIAPSSATWLPSFFRSSWKRRSAGGSASSHCHRRCDHCKNNCSPTQVAAGHGYGRRAADHTSDYSCCCVNEFSHQILQSPAHYDGMSSRNNNHNGGSATRPSLKQMIKQKLKLNPREPLMRDNEAINYGQRRSISSPGSAVVVDWIGRNCNSTVVNDEYSAAAAAERRQRRPITDSKSVIGNYLEFEFDIDKSDYNCPRQKNSTISTSNNGNNPAAAAAAAASDHAPYNNHYDQIAAAPPDLNHHSTPDHTPAAVANVQLHTAASMGCTDEDEIGAAAAAAGVRSTAHADHVDPAAAAAAEPQSDCIDKSLIGVPAPTISPCWRSRCVAGVKIVNDFLEFS